MSKVVWGLLAAFLVTIVAAKLVFEVTSYADDEAVNQPWAQNTMEFVAWNDEKWTAWIRNDAFEQLPQDKGRWNRHSNVSIAYIDWEGRPWQAKIDGEVFLLAHRGDWKRAPERAIAIRYRDWAGENRLRTVAQLRR